jgi:hypothetical protein
MAKSKPKSAALLYDVHPGVAMVQKWVAELPAKTGRSLDDWAALVRGRAPAVPKDRRAWLKTEYGFGTNAAWWVAEYADGSATWDADPDVYLANAAKYVDAMYAGPKAGLRPILDALIAAARKLGAGVKVCPCQTMVPFYRTRVFAEVKPSTRTRVDLALALGEFPEDGRLKVNHQRVRKGDRLTHVVALGTAAEVDSQVAEWLRLACERGG